MYRFEDQGLTLRLFKDGADALANLDTVEAVNYGPGWIAKNKLGRWIDAHGDLPSDWQPAAKLKTGASIFPDPVRLSTLFDGPLELFDHGHIQTSGHASRFKTGTLALPGRPDELLVVRFHNFQFNAMQKRLDAVFEALRNGVHGGYYFASAFRDLCL